MAQVTRTASKAKFETGDVPSQSDFSDMHDSVMWADESHNGVNSQTGTSYTLVLGDANKVVELDNASANTVTVPAEASVAFGAKTTITLVQFGAGQTTIEPAVGVTIHAAGDIRTIPGQYKSVVLYKRGTNEWVLLGAGEAGSSLSAFQLVFDAACDACGITGADKDFMIEKAADIEAADLVDHLVALHPFLGTSVAVKMLNWLDPEDNDLAFRLTEVGGSAVDHAKGLQLGSGVTLNTHINPGLVTGQPMLGGGWYTQDPITVSFISNGSNNFCLSHNDGGSAFIQIDGTPPGQAVADNPDGYHFMQRIALTGANNLEYWRGNTLHKQDSLDGSGIGSGANDIKYHVAGGSASTETTVISCCVITKDAMDSTKAAALADIIEEIMVYFSRNV